MKLIPSWNQNLLMDGTWSMILFLTKENWKILQRYKWSFFKRKKESLLKKESPLKSGNSCLKVIPTCGFLHYTLVLYWKKHVIVFPSKSVMDEIWLKYLLAKIAGFQCMISLVPSLLKDTLYISTSYTDLPAAFKETSRLKSHY